MLLSQLFCRSQNTRVNGRRRKRADSSPDDEVSSISAFTFESSGASSILSDSETERSSYTKASHGSCFSVAIPSLADSTSEEFSDNPFTDMLRSPHIKRRPGKAPPIKVDCDRVSSPFGAAISRLCGYQPVMSRHSQHVFVMRHGERADSGNPEWCKTADRPWDPPLTEWGKWQSFQVGVQLRNEDWGVTRIICSPYLACIETAVQVIKGLTGDENEELKNLRGFALKKDVSKAMVDFLQTEEEMIKLGVCIDFGLCEVMNSTKDPSKLPWVRPLDELEDKFPSSMVERPADSVLSLPDWPEHTKSGMLRFVASIDRLAEQFFGENVIMITHSDAVYASFLRCQKGKISNVAFAGYTHLHRNVYVDVEDKEERGVGTWKLATKSGLTGVYF